MGVAALILAILAIPVAFLSTLLFGTTGIIITVVLAVLGGLLGVLKRRRDKKGGIAAIIIAVVAIILAISMASVWNAAFTELHKRAVESKPDGLWAQVSEDTSHGIFGILSNIPTDKASLDKLVEEMNELNSGVSTTVETKVEVSTAEVTEAPAAEATEAPAE